jgi:glycosyltransferase involved in cell wall biosynthesis
MPSRAESFPYVVLEAAAGQIPMIATDVGGIPELLPPEGLCPPNNADALARHIEMALATPDTATKTAEALSETIKSKFNASDMVRNVTDFYAKLRVN